MQVLAITSMFSAKKRSMAAHPSKKVPSLRRTLTRSFSRANRGALILICSNIITLDTCSLLPPMVLPFILLRAVHVGPPTCMRWRGVGGELGHSFLSFGLRKGSEVMILYYDKEEYTRRHVVSWLHLISHEDGERQCRMKSFQFGGGSLFDIVSTLPRPGKRTPQNAPLC
jgi:hypothetical protein